MLKEIEKLEKLSKKKWEITRQLGEKALSLRRKKILSPREYKILSFRFGFWTHKTHTLEETGELFGVTRERIRQIEAKALERIRVFYDPVDKKT